MCIKRSICKKNVNKKVEISQFCIQIDHMIDIDILKIKNDSLLEFWLSNSSFSPRVRTFVFIELLSAEAYIVGSNPVSIIPHQDRF